MTFPYQMVPKMREYGNETPHRCAFTDRELFIFDDFGAVVLSGRYGRSLGVRGRARRVVSPYGNRDGLVILLS